MRFMAHPGTGFSIGIIGILLAVYFYYAGDKEPKLFLLIHPVRTPIVQAGKLSDVSVALRGKPINGDLTAAQFVIWNSGKAPVRHEDILKPIVLMTASNIPIYEATIRSVSRDVVGFQLLTNDLAAGQLGLDWKILERSDGATIQILYGGNEKLSFSEVGGIVVGQSRIPFQVLNAQKTNSVGGWIAIGFFGFLSLACIQLTKDAGKDLRKALAERHWRGCFDASIGVVFFGALILLFSYFVFAMLTGYNAPPFVIGQ